MGKKEREAAALARRQQQVEQQKKEMADLKKKQKQIFEEGKKLNGMMAVVDKNIILFLTEDFFLHSMLLYFVNSEFWVPSPEFITQCLKYGK